MSKTFFECGLPETVPHLPTEMRVRYEEVRASVIARTNKLQEALELSGMKPETFQVLTSGLFRQELDRWGGVEHFDSLSAQDLADFARLTYTGKDEPYERLDWPNADVMFDTAFATTAEWELIRHIGVGGSDSAVVQGASKHRTEFQLYNDKVGAQPKKSVDDAQAAIFERGHILEDKVIGAFCSRTGAVRIRDTRMFRSKRYPHCIADIDAQLMMPNGKIYFFEAKTTKNENRRAWEGDRIPADYLCQCRHYLGVIDDDRVCGTYIGCLFVVDHAMFGRYVGSQFEGSEFISHLIERDRDIEQETLAASNGWWSAHVAILEPPEHSMDPRKDKEAILQSLPEPDPKAEALDWSDDPDLAYAAGRYLELTETVKAIQMTQIKPLEEERDVLTNKMIERLGSASTASVDMGDSVIRVRYSIPKEKKTIDVEALQALYPEVWEKVTETSYTSRRFTVSEKFARR